jgi:hypothetical protein
MKNNYLLMFSAGKRRRNERLSGAARLPPETDPSRSGVCQSPLQGSLVGHGRHGTGWEKRNRRKFLVKY